MDVAGKRLQRLDGGVHIGGFRIVIKRDTPQSAGQFEAMLHAAKRGDSGAHLFRSAPGDHSHTYGGENVLEVVRAL